MKKELIPYCVDATQIKGTAKDVFFPKNIQEARDIIRNNDKICIRGGGSGLAGGGVPNNNEEIIIDTSKLNNIGQIDLNRKTIEIEPGVIFNDLQNYLVKYKLEFPIEPLSKNICTVGGMVATNAKSPRDFKYKSTGEWVRWIEVMDCDGNIDRKGKTEISDYSGMEGITGLIIKVCLNLIEKKDRSATLVKISDKSKIISVIKHLKNDSSISMVEFIDKRISRGIGLEDKYHIIIEYENNEGLLSNEDYIDLMKKREKIFTYLVNEGYTNFQDPKIILDRFIDFIEWLEIRNIPFTANLGSGIIYPSFFKDQEKYIPSLMKLVKIHGGKVSGSYGIGIIKKEYVEFNDKKIIENIKKRTDTKNKFNLGKII